MASLAPVQRRVRLRSQDYLQLDEAGAFEPYGKTELLDGEIVYMNAQHRPHARLKMALYDALRAGLADAGSSLAVMVEASIALGEHDVPEPDITVTSDPDGEGLIPVAAVALVIEVADATLRSDLEKKARLYARAEVPEYWVADLRGRIVHRLTVPSAGTYTHHDEIAFGQSVVAVTVPGLTVATTGL